MNIDLFYANELLDCYESLLTASKQNILNDYFRNDYSLQEIAENYGISRQAVSIRINRSLKELLKYEEKLHILNKTKQRFKIIDMMRKENNALLSKYANYLKRIEEEE